MAFFPLMIELQNAPCLVVGGGRTALRKAQVLLESGARLYVAAPQVLPELRRLPIEIRERKVQPEDLVGMTLVVDASGSMAAAALLRRECAARRIPLNVVDCPEQCSFLFPAILRRGALVAGISTGGASPLAAAWARDRLDECLPAQLEEILAEMRSLRQRLKRTIPEQPRRAACLRAALREALKKGRPLTGGELARLEAAGANSGNANSGGAKSNDANGGAKSGDAGGGQNPPAGFVYLVGAGCADRELITLRGLRAMRRADVILYDALLPPGLLEFAPRAERIDTGKRGGRAGMTQQKINALMIAEAAAGRVVCRLKGGDAFVFGRGGEEIEALRRAGIPYEVVPGVSSAIAVPELAGIPVTHRGVSRGFHVVTARTVKGLRDDLARLAALPDTLVFLMGVGQLPELAAGLMAGGKSPGTPAAVLGGKTVRAPLGAIAEAARHIRPPAVIVVGDAAALDLRPGADAETTAH